MGVINDMKVDIASSDAAKATAEGRHVFVFKFTMPTLNYRGTASVSGAAEAIEAIEAHGWALSQMSVHPRFRRGSLVMVFRKP